MKSTIDKLDFEAVGQVKKSYSLVIVKLSMLIGNSRI